MTGFRPPLQFPMAGWSSTVMGSSGLALAILAAAVFAALLVPEPAVTAAQAAASGGQSR